MKQLSMWATAYVRPVFVSLFTITVLMTGAYEAWAYETYSTDKNFGNCADCHGNFRVSPYMSLSDGASWGDDLHDVHRRVMLTSDCSTCHGPSRFPVSLDSSNGGTGLAPISCVGCHGREEDIGNDSESTGRGAGLRQHHTNAGVSECADCHSDAIPANYMPVGEDVLPEYYANPGTNHALIPTDPCNPSGSEGAFAGSLLGLDNDGDGIYDTADSDCSTNVPPVADANGPYSGTVGLPVQFDGSGSSDPDGAIVAYDWDFGDGSTGAGVNPAHSYATDATFTVTLTVTDDAGATDAAGSTATITAVPNVPPVADANGPYSGTVGLPVLFDGSGSSDPDGAIVAYNWDFGDGSSGAGVSPAHSYATDGTFTVSLTVTDDAGATDAAGSSATISVPDLLDLDLNALRVTKRVSLARVKPVVLKLVIKNNSTVEGSALATITGLQNGAQVYNEILTVTDGVGGGASTFDNESVPAILAFVPTVAGDILWTATIDDNDPDLDEITAVTRVVP